MQSRQRTNRWLKRLNPTPFAPLRQQCTFVLFFLSPRHEKFRGMKLLCVHDDWRVGRAEHMEFRCRLIHIFFHLLHNIQCININDGRRRNFSSYFSVLFAFAKLPHSLSRSRCLKNRQKINKVNFHHRSYSHVVLKGEMMFIVEDFWVFSFHAGRCTPSTIAFKVVRLANCCHVCDGDFGGMTSHFGWKMKVFIRKDFFLCNFWRRSTTLWDCMCTCKGRRANVGMKN